jgi:hypothetical protein
MSLWNKILLGLIFLASLGFFHAAARTVKTYQYWVNLNDSFEKTLKQRRAEVLRLRTADHEHPLDDKTIGVEQLRIDLGRALANRGRVWMKCEKQKAALAPSGIMNVTVGTEDNAFAKNMLLYAFEEGDDQSPGNYLGEFRVDAVSDGKVVLASTTQMAKSADPKVKSLADHVMESKHPWVLYEMMPADEHEAFLNVPEEQRKWLSDEYLKDGQPVDGKKFERPLRDYLAIFRACEVYRTLWNDRMESATRDWKYLEAAGQEAKNQEAVAEKERTQVAGELERAKEEQAAVKSLVDARKNMLDIYQASVQEAIKQNLAKTHEIAKMQKDAADQIDRRSRSMAQFGSRMN